MVLIHNFKMHSESSSNTPQTSKQNAACRTLINKETDDVSIASKEITSQILENLSTRVEDNHTRLPITLNLNKCINDSQPTSDKKDLIQDISNKPFYIYSNLPSPASLSISTINQPQSLLIQALAKLNGPNDLPTSNLKNLRQNPNIIEKSSEITPPDSLTSAPPSYSFVLRQMAARRPRLMGTFIPSPSFIQHTPPPNYATAFDIYVDTSIPPPPTRVHHFGFAPMPAACPECGYTGMTVVASKITLSTHLCAMILCLLCCWVCAPLPYVLKSCKDVYHYCRNCRNFLGMYCPTDPENVYT